MQVDLEPPDERDPTATSTSDGSAEARWLRITEILGRAWELPASLRESYIEEHCEKDESLRKEVEHLLQQLADSSTLLHSRSGALLGFGFAEIAPGTLLGRYRTLEKIGEGGMGIVYRAVDERLERVVALKVLRYRLMDSQYRDRLLREARMTAALSHPNIVTVYDTGSSGEIDFLAMEYMSGVALDQVISRARLGLENAIRYAAQIASALAKAHSLGIVHRDLKPGNVMLAEDGNVKVLDFGLAKRLEAPVDPVLINLKRTSPDTHQTEQGAVFGTVAYMSPEQARGDAVDERSDIFSFGAILFELVSGRKAFQGTNHPEILNSIERGAPPRLRDKTGRIPRQLDSLVSRCLQTDPGRRPPATEIVLALQSIQKKRRTKTWVVAAAILAAAGILLFLMQPHRVADAQLSAHPLTTDPGDEISSSFSPDGKQVVFAWRPEDEDAFNIYRMPTKGGPPQRLSFNSLCCDLSPVWSPGGQEIAFIRGEIGRRAFIMVVPAAGGSPHNVTSLTSTPWIFSRELDWSPDHEWLAFSDREDMSGGTSIFALAVRTGKRVLVAKARAGSNYLQPFFSPNGRELVFTEDRDGVSQMRLLRFGRDGNPDGASWPIRLRGFENAVSNSPMWRGNSRELLFGSNKSGSGGQLWTVDIAASQRRELVPEMAGSLGEGALLPAISRTGHYLSFTRLTEDKDIWRVNLSGPQVGQSIRLISSTRQENFPQYSPDGRRVAFESDRSGFPEIWISNADGSGEFALTNFRGPVTGSASWSPDSRQIAFDSRFAGSPQVFVIRAEPNAQARLVTTSAGENVVPCWSADGRFIFFSSNRTGDSRIWRVPATGGEAEQMTNGFGFAPQASPEGRYLYFLAGRTFQSEIHRLDLSNKTETRAVAGACDRCFSVTKRGIYYLHNVNAHTELLRFWNAGTKQDSMIARISGRLAGGLSVSPDDRFALFVKDDRGGTDLMLVDNFK